MGNNTNAALGKRGHALLEVMLRQTHPKVQSIGRLYRELLPGYYIQSRRKSPGGAYVHDIWDGAPTAGKPPLLEGGTGREAVALAASIVTAPGSRPVVPAGTNWGVVKRELESRILGLVKEYERRYDCQIRITGMGDAMQIAILKEVA